MERPVLEQTQNELRENITSSRADFIYAIMEASKLNKLDESLLSEQLELYEVCKSDCCEDSLIIVLNFPFQQAAQEAVEGNLMLAINSNNTAESFPPKSEKWTIMQAVFFASTGDDFKLIMKKRRLKDMFVSVCTTIGYGNIVPETSEGRIFCIFFAIIGIPFTLTVIADYGNLFANTVSFIAKKCKALSECQDSKRVTRI